MTALCEAHQMPLPIGLHLNRHLFIPGSATRHGTLKPVHPPTILSSPAQILLRPSHLLPRSHTQAAQEYDSAVTNTLEVIVGGRGKRQPSLAALLHDPRSLHCFCGQYTTMRIDP